MSALRRKTFFKRRSAHGLISSPQFPAVPTSHDPASMNGILADREDTRSVTSDTIVSASERAAYADRPVDHSAAGEPLVQDFQDLYQGPNISAPRTPVNKSVPRPQPLGSHPVVSSDEESAPAPPDFTRRGIHIPTRTSSKTRVKQRRMRSSSKDPNMLSMPTTPESRERSSAESVMSYETSPSSVGSNNLTPLQTKGPPDDVDRLTPLLEDDPQSFDLLEPNEGGAGKSFSLEARSEQLFSREHLQAIFDDTTLLLNFTTFLSTSRPASLPTLIYYLDALKATRAINYANAIAEALEPLEGLDFTQHPARPTVNSVLEDKANAAFEILVREDLPCFITHTFIQNVSVSIRKRITGNLPPLLREASEGLAEVFCLTDPSRPDNPIVFASEEFHRTTQYGVNYAIGRNCRFLQGPKTNRASVSRIRAAVGAGKEISEVFLNYRRDGSPFMNLLMTAPLFDSQGKLRYFIGAQVDVSGLVKECTDLEAMQRIIDKQDNPAESDEPQAPKDEFQDLSEMFNVAELDTVRRHGGRMHREHVDDDDTSSIIHRPRLLLRDASMGDAVPARVSLKADGRLSGVYTHYLLIRPAPSLRILFTSPSLRVPGILQSPFLSRVGGSERVRDSLASALADGSRGVTAKIRWLTTPNAYSDETGEEGRSRWIHCTPLLGAGGGVGVWMVVLVDDDGDASNVRRFREAPPVPTEIKRSKIPDFKRSKTPDFRRSGTPDIMRSDTRLEGSLAGSPPSSKPNELKMSGTFEGSVSGSLASFVKRSGTPIGREGSVAGSMASFALT